uniref:Uncharacterized protein n=1 Tax=Leptobrachium leishanense TaxID=445787 RepID=A0A8C5W837_9ANUR
MTSSHLQTLSSVHSVPMCLIPSGFPLRSLQELCNESNLQTDMLVSSIACHERLGKAIKASLGFISPRSSRALPAKTLQQMMSSRAQETNYDVLLSPYSKMFTSDARRDPSTHSDVRKQSPMKQFYSMKRTPVKKPGPVIRLDAQNAVAGEENPVFNLNVTHTTGPCNAQDVSYAGAEATLSSDLPCQDASMEKNGNEASDEISQNELTEDTASSTVRKPPSSRVQKSNVSAADAMLTELDRCRILNSPPVHIQRKQVSKEKKADVAVSGSDANTRNPKPVVVLFDWVVDSLPDGGMCVDGWRKDSIDGRWHSSVIVKHLGCNLVETLSGQIYELKGGADLESMKQAGYPSDFIQKFKAGFPADWKTLSIFFKEESQNKKAKNAQKRTVSATRSKSIRQSAKTLDSSSSRKEELNARCRRGNVRSLLEPGSQLQSPEPANCGEPDLSPGIENTTYTLSDRSSRQVSLQSPAEDKKAEESSPSLQSSHSCSGKVSRSGRTIKPVLKFWCGERLVTNNNLEVTIQEGSVNQLYQDPVESLRSRFQSKANNTTRTPAKAPTKVKSKIGPESESESSASARDSRSDSVAKKCKRNLPQVMVTPLTKPLLMAKCRSYNLRYQSSERSNSESVDLLTSASPSHSPKHTGVRKTARRACKRQLGVFSSSDESVTNASSSSEEFLMDTEAVATRSHGKSKNKTMAVKRHLQKPARLSVRGTRYNIGRLAKAEDRRLGKKSGQVDKGQKSSYSRRPCRNTASSGDPSDSEYFSGGRSSPRPRYSSGEQEPSCSWHSTDRKWTKQEIQRLYKAVATLDKKGKRSWVEVAKSVQTRTATACRTYYTQQDRTDRKEEQPKNKQNKKARKPETRKRHTKSFPFGVEGRSHISAD